MKKDRNVHNVICLMASFSEIFQLPSQGHNNIFPCLRQGTRSENCFLLSDGRNVNKNSIKVYTIKSEQHRSFHLWLVNRYIIGFKFNYCFIVAGAFIIRCFSIMQLTIISLSFMRGHWKYLFEQFDCKSRIMTF